MNTKKQTSLTHARAGRVLGLSFQCAFRTLLWLAVLASLGTWTSARADRVPHNVPAGYIKADRDPGPVEDDNTNCTVSLLISVNGFNTNNANRGDIRVQIGTDLYDDLPNGVLIPSIAENGRNNYGSNAMQTCGIAPYPSSGAWEIVTWISPFSSDTKANKGEDTVNVSAAYFPFDTFIGGVANNSANGGVLSNFWGSSGLVWGTHFIDAFATNGPGGVAYLDLRSFGIDSRRDGVLLVTHAKNEANYNLSQINQEDGTWTIFTHDNRANGRSYEQDPLAFVFIPKTTTTIVSGMFSGDAEILIHSGNTPAFEVTERLDLGNGQYELKVPGRSPADGILVLSPAGGDPNNGDNIVTYQPNAAGDGWMIQTRDLPGCGLQNLPANEAVCSFVFIPAERPGISVDPQRNLQTSESGASSQFAVTLSGYPKPTADVTVNLASSDLTEGDVDVPSLTFTPNDWGTPMWVTVFGKDDAVTDGTVPYTLNLSATSSADTNFNGLTPGSVGVINIDNEAGVSVDASSITTTEAGGTATFQVWLNTAPTANVTLAVNSSDTSEATVSPGTLTFTPDDYFTPQVITVAGVDDKIQDGVASYFVVTVAATSTDPVYNNFNALDVAGQNLDDDIAKVILPADKITIKEPNNTANIPVKLGSEPTAEVTVNFVSSDTSEGTVTSSLTFTPANWNLSQNITISGVDDLEGDGTVAFTVSATVTSTDSVYSGMPVASLEVETQDNEADLVLPSSISIHGIADGPKGIEGYATVVDPDNADYGSGSVTVTINGATASDRLAVRNTGTGPGQIGTSGNTVAYSGTTIGTVSGGIGTAPLAISLNASATPAAAEALIRSITYQNVNAAAAPQTRTVTVELADGDGGTSTRTIQLATRILRVYTFQQDADGGFGPYVGTGDIQTDHTQPNNSYPAGSSTAGLWIDYDPASLLPEDQSQVLMRFTNIFGTGPGQIPMGAHIASAELVLNIADSGHGARLNRMLMDWDPEFSSFNTLVSGVQLDDIEAVSGTNAFLGDQVHSTTTGGGQFAVGVTSDVQAWANGTNNYGWVLSPWEGGDNGTAFSPSEFTNIVLRPMLRVSWLPQTNLVATFRQGTNDYSGVKDTQIRMVLPDNSYATEVNLAPDSAVNSTPAFNPQQVLIQFTNIIGSGVGQIPPGSVVHAAFLELTSIGSDSQGNGGLFHALLKPWDDTNTWSTWVGGVDADGIEALITPTATLPTSGVVGTVQSTRTSVELTTDVQAWANQTRENHGWVILPWPTGANGWGFNSSEATLVHTRPELRVYYTPGALPENITLEAPVYSAGQVQFKFTGNANRTYTIQRVGALGQTWSNAGTATTDATGKATYTDSNPLAGAGFYRVIYP